MEIYRTSNLRSLVSGLTSSLERFGNYLALHCEQTLTQVKVSGSEWLSATHAEFELVTDLQYRVSMYFAHTLSRSLIISLGAAEFPVSEPSWQFLTEL